MDTRSKHKHYEVFQKLIDDPDKAIESIEKLFGAQLRIFLKSFLFNKDEWIGDVISDTLIAVWLKRKEVVQMSNPVAWMFNVARKRALYRFREEKIYAKISPEDWEHIIGDDEADSKFNANELNDLIQEIAKDELSTMEEQVFIASKVEGLSNKEIGARFGIASQTTKNTLSLGLNKVRRILKRILGK